MSDETRSHRKTELGPLLHGFADNAETLITSEHGVADVYARVQRRRTRRRLGAAAAVCAAVLSAGLWGLNLPLGDAPAERAGTEAGLVPAASILPSPETKSGGRLPRGDLMSPSALPWNTTYEWHTRATSDEGSPAPLPASGPRGCTLSWFDGTDAGARLARTYSGSGRATAQHQIVAFDDKQAARRAVAKLADALHGCGWHETRHPRAQTHKAPASVLYEYVLPNGQGAPLRVTLVQSDHRVAVLVLATPQVADHAHTDPRTERCLEQGVSSGRQSASSASPKSNKGHC